MNKDDKKTIDSLLNDSEFRKIVESDIGKVRNVVVDWENNSIVFYGGSAVKEIKIDETLATLRNQFN